MPEDDNMSIILGRPFLNTVGAIIDCNKGKVTFNVNDKEHTVYFPKKMDKFMELILFLIWDLLKWDVLIALYLIIKKAIKIL